MEKCRRQIKLENKLLEEGIEAKKFPLGAVLDIVARGALGSSTTARLLEYMTGDFCAGEWARSAWDNCIPFLLEQYPRLGEGEMLEEWAYLFNTLKRIEDADFADAKRVKMDFCTGWIARMALAFGEMIDMLPLPDKKNRS